MSGDDDFHEQLRLQQIYGENRDEGPDPYTFVDPSDGTVYEWNLDKKAWFPKVTEDFLALYHANYGIAVDDVNSSSAPAAQAESEITVNPKLPGEEKKTADNNKRLPSQQTEQKSKAEKRKLEPGWFNVEEDRNQNVYVTGLPPDITQDEFVEMMSKCGIIMRDPQTEDYKIKLYKDKEGNLKGDGLCCYLKKESVGLALRLLDESEIRGHKLHVEMAKFQLKGEYDATKKKKKCKDYKKKLSLQQKQLDWRPEKKAGASRMRHERVVIIRNMFHPNDFEEDPLVLNEIREDLRTECEKFGQVKKVIIFDRHPDGVASVSFKEPDECDRCIQALHGRWFGGRQLHAETWNGVTDYQVEETSREREERLKGWETFLDPENKPQTTAADPDSAALNKGLVVGEQPSRGISTEGDVNDQNHKSKDNGQGDHEDSTQSTDSSLEDSDDETDTGQP
ncbi:17S U2 SnRNP complex component HTATSF1 [Microcaecilia unicolor]|uniref:17S U2 SnRNP complex component HTATSF1 n=1 Tax=Microcaecilia unicolor TaxID=1415580 RepID=A0A6P7YRF1_9AMPH|nr:HIV Tat-specific factor 1 [Microcaecilia unicolor]